MIKIPFVTFIIMGTFFLTCLNNTLLGKQKIINNEKPPITSTAKGTSVVVLIDFSKSFPASYRSDGKIIYGLRFEDRRALELLSRTLTELTIQYWASPLKIVWTQIQSSSITENPLCSPVETMQKLVKTDGNIGTKEEIQSVLSKCVTNVVEASKDMSMLGNYTDISGAVAMASEIGSGDFSERIIIIFSDFKEDLPPGFKQAAFQLNGEKVLLLHRSGIDEQEKVGGYLNRIHGWKKKLLEQGAKSVTSMPVFAVSETGLRSALGPQEIHAGTTINIVVDFKNNVFPASGSKNNNENILVQIGQTLSILARDWSPPVTAIWTAIGSSGFNSKTLPPLEFSPSLIKNEQALNTAEDFSMAMEELAPLPSKARGTSSTDISGTLALVCSNDSPVKSNVIIIVSDFIESENQLPTSFKLNPGTRVVMLHKASPSDRSNPNSYTARRNKWIQRFKEDGNVDVFQFPLLSFTSNDLRSCLSSSK